MARTISFINYKGGVGKTTLTVNLATTLALTGRRRVLLIDGDPQSNSSIWTMRLDRWNKLNQQPDATLEAHFRRGKPLAHLRHSPYPEIPTFQVIPCTFDLMDLEQEWQPVGGIDAAFERFRRELDQLKRHYDFIIFDCPPNVYRVSQCALLCSDEVIVPANPDALSLLGLSLVAKKIIDLHRAKLSPEEQKALPYGLTKIRSVFINARKAGAPVEGMIARLEVKIAHLAARGFAWSEAGLCPTHIRDAVVMRRLPFRGKPVLLDQKAKSLPVAEDFIAMAEFLAAMPSTGNAPPAALAPASPLPLRRPSATPVAPTPERQGTLPL